MSGEFDFGPAPFDRTPKVADLVHFVDLNDVTGDTMCRAAIITHVWSEDEVLPDSEMLPGIVGSEWAALHVLGIYGCISLPTVCHDESTKLGRTWHWAH